MSTLFYRNEANTILLFKIFTVGLSQYHKACTRPPHSVAKYKISVSKKTNSTANG